MTHEQIFDFFESLDLNDAVFVTHQSGKTNLWHVENVHLENEGFYVRYFPLGQGSLQLAFIPIQPPCPITEVKYW